MQTGLPLGAQSPAVTMVPRMLWQTGMLNGTSGKPQSENSRADIYRIQSNAMSSSSVIILIVRNSCWLTTVPWVEADHGIK